MRRGKSQKRERNLESRLVKRDRSCIIGRKGDKRNSEKPTMNISVIIN